MIRGLYVAAEGMLARQKAQDVIASNLANANTTGFKADQPVFETTLERTLTITEGDNCTPIGSLSSGAVLSATFTDLSPGAIQTTGNPFDMAIEGEGFFVVQTPNGERYTRNGAFSLNSEGMLVTRDGLPVLGTRGPIQIPPKLELFFGEDGQISAGGSVIDRLLIVNGNLTKEPSGWFIGVAGTISEPKVRSGALEASNVNIVREMVAMIEWMRVYEAHQKVIHAQDEALGRAVNDMARL
jgi:flagellar basal-body rod protein FlgF